MELKGIRRILGIYETKTKTMEVSDIIFLKEDNERVCNIFQWDYIPMDSGSGVCSVCAENRFNDTQPADEYGNNSSDKNKKVIVRHKRKVQIKPISPMTAQNKTQKKETDVKTSDSNKSTNSKF